MIIYPRDGAYPHMYPYGPGAGDSIGPHSDDGSSAELSLPVPVNLFGQSRSSVWVMHEKDKE